MAKVCRKCKLQYNDNVQICGKCGSSLESIGNIQRPVQSTAVKENRADNTKSNIRQKKTINSKKIALIVISAILAVVIAVLAIVLPVSLKESDEKSNRNAKSTSSDETVTTKEVDTNSEITEPEVQQQIISKKISECNKFEVIEYGSYPQSLVTDENLVSTLDGISKNWISYEYYSGNGNISAPQMSPNDNMKYADIEYNGEKYRAVTFSLYRPRATYSDNTSGDNYSYAAGSDAPCQLINEYYTNEVYYFIYEPIKWFVLDPEKGLILSAYLLDAQPFNNVKITSLCEDSYTDDTRTYYTGDYAQSSLRKWLTNDFYNTAFSASEQNCFVETECINSAIVGAKYNSETTYDKVFLLGNSEASNTDYGFPMDEVDSDSRKTYGTDYAKCQGLYVEEGGMSSWWLRNSYGANNGASVLCVSSAGSFSYGRYSGYCTDDSSWINGIRVAGSLDSDSEIVISSIS